MVSADHVAGEAGLCSGAECRGGRTRGLLCYEKRRPRSDPVLPIRAHVDLSK